MAEEKKAQATLGKLLGQAALTGVAALGAEAIYNFGRKALAAADFSSGYRKMLAANPELRGEDAQRVMDRYRILSIYGPTIASDPIVAGGFVRQTLEFPVVTPTVLKEVVDVESKARELMGTGPSARSGASKAVASHISQGLRGPGAGWMFSEDWDEPRPHS
jgi:hypothetical protein